ncbi:membrane protein, TerC family [Plesiocystis pacifica SIR-1]|uniref:Membrane protein, TerC family n=1 Tax=Plesiocystis pacifica SIR-1 TaxID=391625 RepID=A6GEM1_9BACT|nr:TerC family protein [Plesiocystis pacifica]EDM75667.1 membrane protein, TerC family [Plesiocystis pacifica SIR-1]
MGIESVGSPWLWAGFLVAVLFMLALDLGVFHRESQRVTAREALIWSVVWVSLSLVFNAFVWWQFGREPALEWLSAYVIEKSLSVDNIFVFIVIFRYMKVPRNYLHRILFAGILGALILRALFILVGLGLIEMFTWSLYLFGGFLIYTGLKLLIAGDDDPDEEAGDSWVKRKAEQWLRVTRDFEGPVFFVKNEGKWFVTTLFVVLLMVETADVIFALDSIPAIFGISRDPFIVFTSNVCAVLGLRAMFFLLENVIDRFHYLPYGLGVVLAFIGVKMVLAEGIGGAGPYALGVAEAPWLEPIHVPINLSLGIVGSVLVLSVLASLLLPAPAVSEEG